MWYDMATKWKCPSLPCQITTVSPAKLSRIGRASWISPWAGRFSQLPSTPGWCWCHPILLRQLHGKRGSRLKNHGMSKSWCSGVAFRMFGFCSDYPRSKLLVQTFCKTLGQLHMKKTWRSTVGWHLLLTWTLAKVKCIGDVNYRVCVCVCLCGSNLPVSTQTIHIKISKWNPRMFGCTFLSSWCTVRTYCLV